MLGDDDIETIADVHVTAADLFGEDEPQVPPLSPGNNDANAGDGDAVGGGGNGELAGEAGVEIKKKVKKRMLPNLNEKWLTDPSREGLDHVNKYFEKIHLKKGKGNELRNLTKILKRYEYWAQQCYPKLCFKDFVDKVEDQSGKRMIRGCLQDIRNQNSLPADNIDNNLGVTNPIDDGNLGDPLMFPIDFSAPIDSSLPMNSSVISEQPSMSAAPPTLTDEMRENIRKKREEAMAKRKRKFEETLNNSSMSLSQGSEEMNGNDISKRKFEETLNNSNMSLSHGSEEMNDNDISNSFDSTKVTNLCVPALNGETKDNVDADHDSVISNSHNEIDFVTEGNLSA